MQSSDPHVRRLDRDDEWVHCPKCSGWMLSLRDYEVQKSSESPSSDDIGGFILHGAWIYLINFLDDLFRYEGRKHRLAQLKRATLPMYPQSLVCIKCLHVTRRLINP
ncbi:MAG TPA: hypothetical protein VF600_13125 [Abditibacteriaceae bacterium]|jgi:hypothetical protein